MRQQCFIETCRLYSRGYAELATSRLYSSANDISLCAIISRAQCHQHFLNTNQHNSDDEIGMIVRNLLKSMRRDQQGTTAVEVAIFSPFFIELFIVAIAM